VAVRMAVYGGFTPGHLIPSLGNSLLSELQLLKPIEFRGVFAIMLQSNYHAEVL